MSDSVNNEFWGMVNGIVPSSEECEMPDHSTSRGHDKGPACWVIYTHRPCCSEAEVGMTVCEAFYQAFVKMVETSDKYFMECLTCFRPYRHKDIYVRSTPVGWDSA